MGATDFTPTPALLDPTAAVTTYLDGDTMNRDRIVVEASPGAKPNLTLGLLLDYQAGFEKPTTSDRGVLATNETLILGHKRYSYDATAANRIVTLPDGTYNGQEIEVYGTMKSPSYKIEFQHVASSTVPITFPATTSQRPWAVLVWDTSGTDQWIVRPYGGGAALP